MNKSDLIKYNLQPKEVDLLLLNIYTGNEFFVKRVLDRIDNGQSFYDAFRTQYELDNKMNIQSAIISAENRYWDQMNEIYRYS
jgi:hypothetical protein